MRTETPSNELYCHVTFCSYLNIRYSECIFNFSNLSYAMDFVRKPLFLGTNCLNFSCVVLPDDSLWNAVEHSENKIVISAIWAVWEWDETSCAPVQRSTNRSTARDTKCIYLIKTILRSTTTYGAADFVSFLSLLGKLFADCMLVECWTGALQLQHCFANT